MKNIARNVLMGTCIFVLIFFLCGIVPRSQMNWPAYQAAGSRAYEPGPKLGQDGQSVIVAYTARSLQPGGSFDNGSVYYQRLNADGSPLGGRVLVSSGGSDDVCSDIGGDYILYLAYGRKNGLSGDVVLYRISSGESVVIGSADNIGTARICGTNIVWTQGAPAYVMIYDLEGLPSGRPARILAGPSAYLGQADIGQRFVVWTEDLGGQFDIMAYDLSAGRQERLTATPLLSETNPSTSGDWIAWQEGPAASATPPWRILARNLETGETRIVAGVARNGRPRLDGDLLGYESTVSGHRDVYVHRLSSGTTHQVTSEWGEQYFADTSGSMVAYVDLRSGNEDILVRDLNSALATGPVDLGAIAASNVTLQAAAGNPSANLDQGKNGPASDPIPVEWVNGNLNANSSHYVEGFSIPYRITMEDLPIGSQMSIDISYDVINSSKHAIDYLTHYMCMEPHAPFGHAAEYVDPLLGVTGLSGVTPSTMDIPSPTVNVPVAVPPDPFVYLQPFTDFNGPTPCTNPKVMTLWGGTLAAVAYLSEGAVTGVSQSTTVVRITFTPTHSTAVLAWGGHIAKSATWGNGQAATGITGSPYHMRLEDWSVGNLGQQDRSLKASDIIPTGTIVVNKVTVGGDGSFDYQTTGTGINPFTLTTPGSATQSFIGLLAEEAGGSRSITESPAAGWTRTGLAVQSLLNDGTSIWNIVGGTVNITKLGANDTLTITYTNTLAGHIIVDKVTAPAADPQSFAFTTTGSGYSGFSLTDAAAPNDSGALVPGTYSVSETPVAGWDTTVTINGIPATNGQSISLAAGQTVNVVYTNTKRGHIIVDKVTAPAADPQSFAFTTTGSGYSGFSLTDAAAPNDSGALVPGTYSVSETAVAGWETTVTIDGAPATNGQSISLAAGQTVNVVFTNTKGAHIIVDKVTVPAADPQSFAFITTGSGYSGFSLTDAAAPNDSGALVPGTYSVSETPVAGWDTTVTIDGVPATNGQSIGLAAGQTVNVVYTNTKRGHIIVDKVTVPAADPQSFAFTTTGSGYSGFSLTDVATPNDSGALIPGTYSVSETPVAGWDTTVTIDGVPATNGQSINLAAGQTVNVVYTNTKRGHIIVDKVTVPAADPQSFAFMTTGSGYSGFSLTDVATPNDSGALVPGTYSISETAVPGWNMAVTIDGAPATNGQSINLAAGQTVNVVYTNTKAGHIIVDKVTVPAADPQSFAFTTTGSGYSGFSLTDAATPNDSGALDPGTYTVSETPVAGWDTTVTIDGAPATNGQTINLAAGQTVNVVYTNTKRGLIIVDKVTVPAADPQSFAFTTTGDGYSGFSLTDAAAPNDSGALVPGAYSVSETPVAGWDTTVTIDGAPATNGQSISLAAGQTVNVVYTNTKRGHIIVDKVTVPAADPQSFAFTTTGSGYSGFSLTDAAAPNDSGALVPGAYSVSETPVAGWDTTVTIDGVPATNGQSINLVAGQMVNVVYTNTKRGQVRVIKTETVGGITGAPALVFTFVLDGGPDSVHASLSTTLGNGALDFGLLKPGAYTLTELAVAAGTHSTLEDQGGVVQPNGDIVLAFTLAAGEERTFSIDNWRPLGDTRTIGYWRNWNSCSHDGAFVARSAQTGNHLADEFLPIFLGTDDGDGAGLLVDSCQIAVAILSKTSVDGTSKNNANDAAYGLAAQLLAAILNVKAGAAHSSYVDAAINEALLLLENAGFNGTGDYWKGGRDAAAQRQTALSLAAFLDQYNNGMQ